MILDRLSSLVVQLDKNSFMKSSLQAPIVDWFGESSKFRFARHVINPNLVSSGKFGLSSILLMAPRMTLPGSE